MKRESVHEHEILTRTSEDKKAPPPVRKDFCVQLSIDDICKNLMIF